MKDQREHMAWLDVVRGTAIWWVFLVHFIERFMTGSLFANPNGNWPPLSMRVAQLTPLDIDGPGGIAVNLLRYVGWLGDQGVQIFLVASGFGLALSALKNSAPISVGHFYRKRLARILPLWLAAHLLFMATDVILSRGLPPTDWRTWASLLGLRCLPGVFYFKFPAWWYIGLILQLYLVFPWLCQLLRRWSPWRFLMIVGGLAMLVRLAGLYAFDQHLDWWSRGGLFVSRLPEFAFGMAFAKWHLHADHTQVDRLKSPAGVAGIIGLYLLGNICSFFLAGMAVAFLMTGAGVFLLVFALLSGKDFKATAPLAWSGRRSYAVYLIHHPVVLFLVPAALAPAAAVKVFGYLAAALAVSIGGAVVLESATRMVLGFLQRHRPGNAGTPDAELRRTAKPAKVAIFGSALKRFNAQSPPER